MAITRKPVQSSLVAQQTGFRLPAEWEPVERVWLTTPHNNETWPDCLDAAQRQFAFLNDQLRSHVETCTTQSRDIPTNDSWIRDYGPLFVVHEDGRLACHNFLFNCWGAKYEPYDLDNEVPPQIAQHIDIPIWHHDLVLEGGSIDTNGAGSIMTTRQCLLNPNRNPQLSELEIEELLHGAFGTYHCLWLPGGIEGDDTDGHIDDVARFINPTTVAAVLAPQDHPDHTALQANWTALQEGRDQNGARLNLLELPAPKPLFYNYPADVYGPAERRQLPASYANFLITNKAVFVPIFGQHNDDVALRRLDDAMPGYHIVGVRCELLVVGLGAIHCMTMQQPATSMNAPSSPGPNRAL